MKRVGRRANRSVGGDIALILGLGIIAVFMALPLVYTISNALKPLDEIWEFPPKFIVRRPTLDNFRDLAKVMLGSWVPFGRYLFNTLFVTVAGTGLHIAAASMAAYPLAKIKFPGANFLFSMVVLSLMFSTKVTGIPNYLILSRMRLIDTSIAIILPAIAMPLGLFLMKQFMDGVPDSILDSARIDGANEFRILIHIVMPVVKPAWLTLMLFSFQDLWRNPGSAVIYSEEKKLLPYALNQVLQGGFARTGAAYAVTFLMMIVPIVIFIITQSNVIQTMASSGIKE